MMIPEDGPLQAAFKKATIETQDISRTMQSLAEKMNETNSSFTFAQGGVTVAVTGPYKPDPYKPDRPTTITLNAAILRIMVEIESADDPVTAGRELLTRLTNDITGLIRDAQDSQENHE